MPEKATTAAGKVSDLPKCWRKRATDAGGTKRCTNPGFPVWVTGSFGRSAQILCHRCIEEVKAIGWKVHYQIEGDNPEPRKEA